MEDDQGMVERRLNPATGARLVYLIEEGLCPKCGVAGIEDRHPPMLTCPCCAMVFGVQRGEDGKNFGACTLCTNPDCRMNHLLLRDCGHRYARVEDDADRALLNEVWAAGVANALAVIGWNARGELPRGDLN